MAQEKTPFEEAPEWSKKAIWYQIFVERFSNGDTKNDPTPNNMNVPEIGYIHPKDWKITPWTQQWYGEAQWEKNLKQSPNMKVQYRRYGGDLKGVLDKLNYLKSLGINAIYFNPLNDAPSLHKYDARYYHHIDIHFGPDPEGDKIIIAGEDPNDPNTWKWTSADLLFLEVIKQAHNLGIKVILDFSWNHTGQKFWAFQDIIKNQGKSKYLDWYNITSVKEESDPKSKFEFEGWLGYKSLPEIKKVNITTKREIGKPYEGDINEGAKKHIFDVTRRWLAPDGHPDLGVDGFRLDVADHIGLVFWRDYRKWVRSIKPDAYLVGEIWWEEWPDKLMDPAPYTSGDVFDAVMFYQIYKPARYFFAKNDYSIDAVQFKEALQREWGRLRESTRYAMMNTSSTHDTPRLLTDFYNPNKYKYKSSLSDDPTYKTGKPDKETYARVRLYLVHLFTNIGAPAIWNGEEFGMWGADDPHCRKPLTWPELKFEPETRNPLDKKSKETDEVIFNKEHFDWYRKLIKIRNQNPVLSTGKIDFMHTKDKELVYKRYDGNEEIIVLFNAGNKEFTYSLKKGARYENLLDGAVYDGTLLILNPLTSLVLKELK
jgi:glycosidase